MTQAVEKKSMPGFFDEAVCLTSKSRQLGMYFGLCQQTTSLGPMSADHYLTSLGCQGCLFWFVCTLTDSASLLWFSLQALSLFFNQIQTLTVNKAHVVTSM